MIRHGLGYPSARLQGRSRAIQALHRYLNNHSSHSRGPGGCAAASGASQNRADASSSIAAPLYPLMSAVWLRFWNVRALRRRFSPSCRPGTASSPGNRDIPVPERVSSAAGSGANQLTALPLSETSHFHPVSASVIAPAPCARMTLVIEHPLAIRVSTGFDPPQLVVCQELAKRGHNLR